MSRASNRGLVGGRRDLDDKNCSLLILTDLCGYVVVGSWRAHDAVRTRHGEAVYGSDLRKRKV